MQIVNAILANEILIAGGTAWILAQITKTIIYLIINKQLRLERLIGDGGMPSCHSATVSAVAASAAITTGVSSPEFAIALILAIVVMHDAMGVRLETGKQAVVLNELIHEFRERGVAILSMSPEQRLKEFVGHTGSQVCIGSLIGIVVAVAEYYIFYR